MNENGKIQGGEYFDFGIKKKKIHYNAKQQNGRLNQNIKIDETKTQSNCNENGNRPDEEPKDTLIISIFENGQMYVYFRARLVRSS